MILLARLPQVTGARIVGMLQTGGHTIGDCPHIGWYIVSNSTDINVQVKEDTWNLNQPCWRICQTNPSHDLYYQNIGRYT